MPAKDREAIALIERAVAIAPDDAAAWGLLALAHARAEQHAAPDLANPATALIDEAAQRALALDPANADARAAIALAIPYFGDWLAAERRFDPILADHRPRGTSQMLVRANAQQGEMAVEDPKPYQDFFAALEKAMFLTAHEVD